METSVEKIHNKNRNLLIAISSVFTVIAALSFIFHISPKELSSQLANFSKHHYFLSGFICLVIALISAKLYFNQRDSQLRSNTVIPVGRIRSKRRRLNVILQNLKRSINYSNDSKSISINKSEIAELKFLTTEALTNPLDIEERKNNLQSALTLGNLYKQKVIICFQNKGVKRHTLATVWHLDDENVSLKGGVTIPIRNIYKVEL